MPRKMTPAKAIRITASTRPTGSRPATSHTAAQARITTPAMMATVTGLKWPLSRPSSDGFGGDTLLDVAGCAALTVAGSGVGSGAWLSGKGRDLY